MKIIILTAFDEFEYAKQCIGLGITDYLLKPIVRADIQSACKKAIHELDSQPIAVPEQSSSYKICHPIWTASNNILMETLSTIHP